MPFYARFSIFQEWYGMSDRIKGTVKWFNGTKGRVYCP